MATRKFSDADLRKAQELLDLEDAIEYERRRRERLQAAKSTKSAAAKKARERKRAERARALEDAVDQKTGGSIWVRSPLIIAIVSAIALGSRLVLDERTQTILCADGRPGEPFRLITWAYKTALCDPNVPFALFLLLVFSLLAWLVILEKNRVRADLKRKRLSGQARD